MMDFQSFAAAHGLQISRLYPSNEVQRCATADKPRSKNGAIFWDGQRGWVCDWAQGGEVHWFDNGQTREFTETDKKAWLQRKQSFEHRQETNWGKAVAVAGELIRTAEPKPHKYLQYKGLPDSLGLVTPTDDLIVPMRNFASNALQGAQVIRWLPEAMKYEKKMLYGMRAKGAVLRLGPRTAFEAILCEGYATGLTIELAARMMRLPACVLVCFSANNMGHVASMVKGRAYCFADNDASGTGQHAAEKTGLPFCMSDVVGEDANDLYVRAGLLAVAKILSEVRRKT